ncbi:MAG: hypothetical protein HC910_07120 [Spirulinaceae cyanobacterium SM2_1_0]|nr:hypothetical protein [Spirulinaceae cyanobacterium SM2_1_0]
MVNYHLSLEISESLRNKLARIAELAETNVETVAVRILARRIPQLLQETENLSQLLASIPDEAVHAGIDCGEPVGSEIL